MSVQRCQYTRGSQLPVQPRSRLDVTDTWHTDSTHTTDTFDAALTGPTPVSPGALTLVAARPILGACRRPS
jgi:hypothetical protein